MCIEWYWLRGGQRLGCSGRRLGAVAQGLPTRDCREAGPADWSDAVAGTQQHAEKQALMEGEARGTPGRVMGIPCRLQVRCSHPRAMTLRRLGARCGKHVGGLDV